MNRSIANVTLLVADYDEAISYYTQKLKFKLIEDSDLGDGKRWVTISPGSTGTTLLLAKATSVEQHRYVGNQTDKVAIRCASYACCSASSRLEAIIVLGLPKRA